MSISAFIAGCAGFTLSSEELAFFKEARPWGFILFKRNIETPGQVKALVASLRDCVGYESPVLIDQEGGRVQRLGPPFWPKYPTGAFYERLYARDKTRGREMTRLYALKMAQDLRVLGINVNCLPVLDVPQPDAHDIIGDRAYGADPKTIATLGRAAAEGLLAGCVLPVIKHIPGHGRAGADSHESLPVVDASRDVLEKTDFAPFNALSDMPLAMTAHVVYSSIDPNHPATTSRIVIERVIRASMKFDGLLMSDDLSMKALQGSMRSRTQAVFKAGCDMALHCNGNMDEMQDIASEAPQLSGQAKVRAMAALQRIQHEPEHADFDMLES